MNQLSACIRAVTTTAILLAASWANGAEAEKEIWATGLKCEYLENPLCVENPTPRLSWKMVAAPTAKRNQRQTWYRLLAASSRELLDNDQADLWDSGTVELGEEMQIQYGGKEVPEGKRCYWKVKVGNNYGETSDWSETAYWGSGVRTWQADWIGDRPDTALAEYLDYVRTDHKQGDFDTERWTNPPTLPSPMLRRSFKLDERPREAVIYASALGYYELWINGHRVGDAM